MKLPKTIDWMNGEISREALAQLAERAAQYDPRLRELETFWRDTSLRQVQYFVAVLEDPFQMLRHVRVLALLRLHCRC